MLGSKDIGIIKSELVTKTQFLSMIILKFVFLITDIFLKDSFLDKNKFSILDDIYRERRQQSLFSGYYCALFIY